MTRSGLTALLPLLPQRVLMNKAKTMVREYIAEKGGACGPDKPTQTPFLSKMRGTGSHAPEILVPFKKHARELGEN